MSRECFVEKNFRADSLATIAAANKFIEQYQQMGIRITLRQLYYRFVEQNLLPNTIRSYKNLGAIISDARLAGLIDWSAIEDGLRSVNGMWGDRTLDETVSLVIDYHTLDHRKGQENYIEVWLEKDTLARLIEPVAHKYHVPVMVNRGYSSSSAMYESANRLAQKGNGRTKIIYYFGDHDPSGEDMVRDIEERLCDVFLVEDLAIVKVALTKAQIEQYRLPPNPAKMSDSRAEGYVAKHGTDSWEIESLRPDVLQQLCVDVIEGETDDDLVEEVLAEEEKQKTEMRARLDKKG